MLRTRAPAKRVSLSQERIAEAAMYLVEREGVEALTMRRLGRELGVKGASLYNHISSKEDVIADVVQAMFAKVRPCQLGAASWKAELREIMRSFRSVALAYPSGFALYAARAASPMNRSDDDLLLEQAGFPPLMARNAMRVLSSYVAGFVSREVAGAWLGKPGSSNASEMEDVFEFGLATILDGLEDWLKQNAAVQD